MRMEGHDWLIALEKKVINISLGGSVFSPVLDQVRGYCTLSELIPLTSDNLKAVICSTLL